MRDLLDASSVVTVCGNDVHWLMFSASFDTAKIIHLDSLGGMPPDSRKKVIRFLLTYLDILRNMASSSTQVRVSLSTDLHHPCASLTFDINMLLSCRMVQYSSQRRSKRRSPGRSTPSCSCLWLGRTTVLTAGCSQHYGWSALF